MVCMGTGDAVIRSGHEDERWHAVLARDEGCDGSFVYAVRSTGIFCRPSCPSRKPGRDQVAFYDRPADALAAGYRACRRCRPLGAGRPEEQRAMVREACALIESEDEARPTLSSLAAAVGTSPFHLQRLFKRAVGVSPKQYAEAVRLRRLKTLLKEGEPVALALYGAGYGSASRLYEKAPSRLGMTPASYARGGRGARIAFACAEAPGLGRILIAATVQGVCMVALGGPDAELEAELRAEYPAADIGHDEGMLHPCVGAVLALAAGKKPDADLPLDVRATAFQWKVWSLLRSIPAGSTRSYGDIAAELGRPGAARAVGRACASNPVALVVPCHRAVGGDGGLHGYRWGVERKRTLLDKEREGASRPPEDVRRG